MLDAEYFTRLLQAVGDASYMGVSNTELFDRFVEKPEDGIEEATTLSGQKFKYHMDEAWMAGLIRPRDGSALEPDWGLKMYAGGRHWGLMSKQLVLTPIGAETLAELKKPKGLEKFKGALRGVGAEAGKEAVKAAVGFLLTAS